MLFKDTYISGKSCFESLEMTNIIKIGVSSQGNMEGLMRMQAAHTEHGEMGNKLGAVF